MKPLKHKMLGLGIKSLTCNRKILTISNKLGRCVSYTTAKELETEMIYSAIKNNLIVPPRINLQPDLSTNVAWNNFDRYVRKTEAGYN